MHNAISIKLMSNKCLKAVKESLDTAHLGLGELPLSPFGLTPLAKLLNRLSHTFEIGGKEGEG